MTDEEVIDLLDELESELDTEAREALTAVSEEFGAAVEASTELVAAAFSVSRIGAMWRRRVPGLLAAIRRIAVRGAQVASEELDELMPPDAELDDQLAPYFEAVRVQLDDVGDRLSETAVQALSEGVAAGDTHEQLQARMLAVFSDTGAQLGPVRARRIAATQATSGFNAGALAAARALTGPERPLVKQWLTRNDERVRRAHRDVNGQVQFLDDAFDVDGSEMQFPGDPTAPADLVVNCRCILRTATAPTERTASVDPEDLSAAADVHTGAMVALIPHPEDAARLALESGEPVDQLHATLLFLGKAADWSEDQRHALGSIVRSVAGYTQPITARAFGVAHWNPAGDSPAWVYSIGDGDGEALTDLSNDLGFQVMDQLGQLVPAQYTPWSPHVTGVYSQDDHRADMAGRLGPVRFDRIRVAFAGEHWDFPLIPSTGVDGPVDNDVEGEAVTVPPVAPWSTPDPAALAFENQQTGEVRIIAPGALHWNGSGPWPLQYADEMQGGHDGARLAGAIESMGRDGDRITGDGVLYLTQDAGVEAAMLLGQGAPLGVSVDLDDVDLEFVDTGSPGATAYRARLLTASVTPTGTGGWVVTGESVTELSASSDTMVMSSRKVSLILGEDCRVPGGVLDLVAAAGDPDPGGTVVESQRSGDFLLRITRGRVRGATLVTIPAYADARIVLDDPALFAAADTGGDVTAAASGTTDYDRVLRHVRASRTPVGAARVAQFLVMPVVAAQRLLARAAARGEVVRLSRGLYTDSTTSAKADHVMYDDLAASVTGAVNLPVASRERAWDGDAAARRVFEWADGDTGRIGQAFAYRDDDKDPETLGAYKLGYADVVDGVLTIIPSGVSAAIGALNGARGGVDLPDDERDDVTDRLEEVRAHVAEETGDDAMDDMQASAWAVMQDLPPMPAAWFREPTAEELPPGGPGVNYADGRIFGWVAQAGEPHAGFAKKITIDTLGRIETQHFLRQKFTLDDGSVVKAGAYTMNVGHHRDSAECETASCQFDDTRTVAGIVTVGMNKRGMWFSGAAAPWLSAWDRKVFAATQPSYHMKRKGPSGNWQLRAVLSVPVPGHSSPLLASAVIERAQLALTAAATMAEVDGVIAAEEARQSRDTDDRLLSLNASIDYDRLADAIVASQGRAEERRAAEDAELAELLALADSLVEDTTTGTEGA